MKVLMLELELVLVELILVLDLVLVLVFWDGEKVVRGGGAAREILILPKPSRRDSTCRPSNENFGARVD